MSCRTWVSLALLLTTAACAVPVPQPAAPSGLSSASRRKDGNDWTLGPAMPTVRYGMAAGVIDGKLITAGGFSETNGTYHAETEAYDPATGQWSKLPPLPTPRHEAAAGVIGRRLYVAGGFNRKGLPAQWPLKTVECFDASTGVWQSLPDMPQGVIQAQGAVLGNEFHVLSGHKVLDAHFVYAPESRTWRTAPALPFKRQGLAVVGVGNRIYCWGGVDVTTHEMTRSGAVYDGRTRRWLPLPDMPVHRYRPVMASDGDTLYLVGGSEDGGPLPTTFHYDIREERWSQGPDLQCAHFKPAVGVIGRQLLVAAFDPCTDGAQSLEIRGLGR